MSGFGKENKNEDKMSFEILPAGWYPAIAIEQAKGINDAGNHKFSVTFKIFKGNGKNRRIWGNFNLINKNDMATKIARGQLWDWMQALDIDELPDYLPSWNEYVTEPERTKEAWEAFSIDPLMDLPLEIFVKVTPEKPKDQKNPHGEKWPARNEIADFRKFDGVYDPTADDQGDSPQEEQQYGGSDGSGGFGSGSGFGGGFGGTGDDVPF